MSIYISTLSELRVTLAEYKQKNIDLDTLIAAVWQASSEVVLIEEKELRLFLQKSEAELDSLKFTVDDNLLFSETLKVVERMEARLPD